MKRGIFVTGTDTGVGKTLAACALIHALAKAGVRPVPMKPIAAGAVTIDGAHTNEDTLALMSAAGFDASWASSVTPILLAEALAPHIAAAREGRPIGLGPVREAIARLEPMGNFLVVEGVGGFHVPLGDALDTMDLARLVGLPVVMVVGLRLGCLNHALLTKEAIRHTGLTLAGWIANAIDPQMQVLEENVAALRTRLGAPLLGRIPWSASHDARALSAHLDVRPLLNVSLSRP
jgi:dethiobiotin synthetase